MQKPKCKDMKRIKNTGYRLTITLDSAGTLCGKVATSTVQCMVDNLLRKYTLYNTSIRELPGAIHAGSGCSTHITTLLQIDFLSPDKFLPNCIVEELKEQISPEIHLLPYQICIS